MRARKEIVSSLVVARLSGLCFNPYSSYILDGYPLNMHQAKSLEVNGLAPTLAVYLQQPRELLKEKLVSYIYMYVSSLPLYVILTLFYSQAGRRTCKHCGTNYNVGDIHFGLFALCTCVVSV